MGGLVSKLKNNKIDRKNQKYDFIDVIFIRKSVSILQKKWLKAWVIRPFFDEFFIKGGEKYLIFCNLIYLKFLLGGYYEK